MRLMKMRTDEGAITTIGKEEAAAHHQRTIVCQAPTINRRYLSNVLQTDKVRWIGNCRLNSLLIRHYLFALGARFNELTESGGGGGGGGRQGHSSTYSLLFRG